MSPAAARKMLLHKQGQTKSLGEREGKRGVLGEQVVGSGCRYGGEDGQPQGGAEPLGGVDQARGETRLVGWHAGVGCGGDPHEDGAEAQGHQEEPGEQVGQIGTVDRYAGEKVDGGGGERARR